MAPGSLCLHSPQPQLRLPGQSSRPGLRLHCAWSLGLRADGCPLVLAQGLNFSHWLREDAPPSLASTCFSRLQKETTSSDQTLVNRETEFAGHVWSVAYQGTAMAIGAKPTAEVRSRVRACGRMFRNREDALKKYFALPRRPTTPGFDLSGSKCPSTTPHCQHSSDQCVDVPPRETEGWQTGGAKIQGQVVQNSHAWLTPTSPCSVLCFHVLGSIRNHLGI